LAPRFLQRTFEQVLHHQGFLTLNSNVKKRWGCASQHLQTAYRFSNSTLLMKRQRIDANRRLAVASRGCGQAGQLLSEGVGLVERREEVLGRGLLLLEDLLAGVFNGYAKCIKVIECVAIRTRAEAYSEFIGVFVNGGPDCAALWVTRHWFVSVEVLFGFAPRARQGYGPDKTS
jgi:hypothetical protein